MRGGERVLEIFCELYPEADLFTLLHVKGRLPRRIEGMRIHTSFIQRLPKASDYYRYYLPFFPSAIEQFDLRGYDLVLSSSHCAAKGVVPMPESLHISYCFTPMRYVWDMYREYFRGPQGGLKGMLISALAHSLRTWDVTSSARVDEFIAISRLVQQRIRKYYRRESTVIHPPVDCDYFRPPEAPGKGDYYLMVTALVPYKRVDLAVEAFNRTGRPLLIVGDGQETESLKKKAKKNVEFLGWQPDDRIREFYQGCRAFIFPGKEDFGITPVEAQACGKPVIAYGTGGVLETVRALPGNEPTGVFFREPSPDSLIEAVEAFERHQDRFDPRAARENALTFDRTRFRERIRSFIAGKLQEAPLAEKI
jgi:glycosyltransferase involved in cell wall biosynthesis